MEIESVLKFCTSNDIHLNEFIIMYLTGKNDSLLNEYLEKYSYEDKLSGLNIPNLIERGFIDKQNEDFVITKKFYNLFSIDDLFYIDIYEPYPGFVTVLSKQLITKSGDDYELCKLYKKRVFSIAEHEEVKLDLEYALENDLIQFSITNFINGYYKEIRKIRLKGGKNEIVNQNLNEE